jgi:putative Mg2+ transporter-C (MgtC) family protein
MLFLDTILNSYQLGVAAKLLLTLLACGAIGLERERHDRPAGLRTHILVGLGACLMMIISEAFPLKYAAATGDSILRLDPARTAAQIISGVGFLGAGVILKEGVSVQGLTTAASLWLVAGLGMALGMGLVGPAALTTLIALFSLIVLKKLEPVLRKNRYLQLTLMSQQRENLLTELEAIFARNRLRIANFDADYDLENQQIRYDFVLTQHHRRIGQELSNQIMALDGIKRISFK